MAKQLGPKYEKRTQVAGNIAAGVGLLAVPAIVGFLIWVYRRQSK